MKKRNTNLVDFFGFQNLFFLELFLAYLFGALIIFLVILVVITTTTTHNFGAR